MLQIIFILGCILIGWAAISIWYHNKEQRKIQETVARNRQESTERKTRREEGRGRRKTVQEWENEFKLLNATQFFNPRRGGRLDNLIFKKHNYRAEIKQSANQAGLIFRKLVVSDSEGRLVKVQMLTDNMDASAYRDCIISDSTGLIIGGWQLAHEEIPYEFAAASINLGYVYSEALDLPTTVSIGYNPNPLPGGLNILVTYKFLIGGKEKNIAEKYLEDHFADFFPEGHPGGDVDFRKFSGVIHVSPPTQTVIELTPEQKTADVKQLPINSQAFGAMLLRQKELQTIIQTGENLSNEEQKEYVMLQFLLGSSEEVSLIKTQKLNFEDAKDIRAIDEFTLGEIKTLLTAQGLSHGDVIRFLGDVQSGALTLNEANQFLQDCKEWNGIKNYTQLSKEKFFSEKLALRKKAKEADPSRN